MVYDEVIRDDRKANLARLAQANGVEKGTRLVVGRAC
jgi:hypothetical protein